MSISNNGGVMPVSGLAQVLQYLAAHETLLWSMAGLSILIFLGSLLALPVVIARLPQDYFMATQRRHKKRSKKSLSHVLMMVGKNIVGAVLLLLGMLLLVLPGQGLLTIAVGVMLLNFPGKYRLERWVVSRAPILNALNWVRKKKQCPPLEMPKTMD